MLTAEELTSRQQEIAGSDDLTALLQRLSRRAEPLLQRMPTIPSMKAMLTADGGFCPDDGTRLDFDPWSPLEHRCSRCGRCFQGERHDAAWAHYQHLWLAERSAHLATVGVLGNREDAGNRANELLQGYRNYADYPNRDNVLGPSHLFFSTYLESIWLVNCLSAAILLREAGQLRDDTAEIVNAIADESAGVIGEFDEGLSNRQTWHNAALASVAVWFEDEELATRVIEGPSGILTHLLQGFGSDGMWYEGDNYHLFALRGQLLALAWARQAGVDMLADPVLASRISAALRAPALTALPDFTFPARKDSRFGVSLAQPMYLELWEVGLGRLTGSAEAPAELWDWLEQVYQSPAPAAQTFDSYLQEAGEEPPKRPRTRADLSWWSLLEMAPALVTGGPRWTAKSTLLEGQGLAVLRAGGRYVSLECGAVGGGHGHADRLNLVLHANGEYWLPDLGTGSYVARDLFWYRSTLAHNAPRLDGVSQPRTDAACDSFEDTGSWAWARGRWGDVTRTVVTGPSYILDVVELTAEGHVLELPFHLNGQTQVESPGEWQSDSLADEFTERAERFVPETPGNLVLRSCGSAGTTMRVILAGDGELLRALGPGTPGTSELVPFYLLRATGRSVRLVTVLEPTLTEPGVLGIELEQNAVAVESSSGVDRHVAIASGWQVHTGSSTVRLGGARQQVRPFQPVVQVNRPLEAQGFALHVVDAPELTGTLDGFDLSQPLELDHEDQYRRSEEPYPEPEEFSARAYLNWNDEALYLAVDVTKPEVLVRGPSAPPLRLDNEPDEIHGDGIQVYLRRGEDEGVAGWLIVPSTENGDLIVRQTSDSSGDQGSVRGAWQRRDNGYTITVAITPPEGSTLNLGDEVRFDLLVNRALPQRTRRAGQLVWSGGSGWVWLRGDRQDPSRFGTIELR